MEEVVASEVGSLNQVFQSILTVMIIWVFLSIVLEEVFNTLFEWKIYRNHVDGKGLKFPIKMAILLFLVNTYPGMDIFHKLLKAMGLEGTSGAISYSITALLLSGGSSTAFKVLKRMREAKKKLEEDKEGD